MRDMPRILLITIPCSLRTIAALHLAYTNPYTIGNTAVFTTDYIIVLMFVNTNVFVVVNTGVITGVWYVVMAFVLLVFCGAFFVILFVLFGVFAAGWLAFSIICI